MVAGSSPAGYANRKPQKVMKPRSNKHIMKISVQDSAGNTAPYIVVDTTNLPAKDGSDKRPAAIKEARERSGLSRFSNWQFH